MLVQRLGQSLLESTEAQQVFLLRPCACYSPLHKDLKRRSNFYNIVGGKSGHCMQSGEGYTGTVHLRLPRGQFENAREELPQLIHTTLKIPCQKTQRSFGDRDWQSSCGTWLGNMRIQFQDLLEEKGTAVRDLPRLMLLFSSFRAWFGDRRSWPSTQQVVAFRARTRLSFPKYR